MASIPATSASDLESSTMRKVTWRLVPFLMLCYFIAYLDRVNIGFAGATMRTDLNLSATAFGGAAGIFFVAYFFFEVPSNLALNAFGARRWIARIMLSWGIISGTQAFVVGEWSFNLIRMLLGVAEAGSPASSSTSRCGFRPPTAPASSAGSCSRSRSRP
jgi:sugar phosphate permease